MPKVRLSNVASQYGIDLSALKPNLDPTLHVVDAWKETGGTKFPRGFRGRRKGNARRLRRFREGHLLEKRRAYGKAQRKQLRSDLISAMEENPAPTVRSVCARLGVSPSRIYFLHRDLAQAIAARHLRQRAESLVRRRELL